MASTDKALRVFEDSYGTGTARKLLSVHAPGRSEIAGNHTDHEGGHVIAGALDVAIDGVAAANGTASTVRVASEGHGSFEIDLSSTAPVEAEKVSTAALVRGMADALTKAGKRVSGFDVAFTSTVPSGGGLSSSAAMEAALGRAMEALWEGDVAPVSPIGLAKMSQRTENEWFGKPCGLMDQASVCLGGLAHMGFADAENPTAEKLALDFEDFGYSLCLVDVGCDHAPFTADYAAVPVEMQQVATEFGKKRLCEVDEAAFDEALPALREKLGDRACLRAVHYYYEDDLVERRWAALRAGDIDSFLALTRASGASSAMYLQNVSTAGAFQPAMYALGLAERILCGKGAVRIHGGGFGGSIQAFVPTDMVETFAGRMNGWLGDGSARKYQICEEGACATWL
ncbi:galactokinase [Paratractidigestivibacter sp.]|uniref:galactokinase n=1 Tax=Paratractidigestivibacter sp. TaxID=2847316 RepID=UPI002AC8FE27|nr:galactokinase family protein [Paratractidigestivibacter sp.]